MNRYYTFLIFIFLVLAASGFRSDQPTRYFLSQTLSFSPEGVKSYTFDFNDELPDDTLFQTITKEGYPLHYYRRLKGNVCFDDKCRLLDVVVYWNITGRYLGFELPPKEFLSKTEHEPFTEDEYQRLNTLLADEQSALASMSYEELVPRQRFIAKGIDGVTSATAKNVLDYIVKGAAYTTYTMWHFIYGPTRQRVVDLTLKSLSPDLIIRILESGNSYDKLWVLNNIRGNVIPNPEVISYLLRLIDRNNYSLSERAINAISPNDLKSDSLQVNLFSKFNQVDYSLKKLLVGKLKESPFLNEQVKDGFAAQLGQLSAELFGDVLALYHKFSVQDTQTTKAVSLLLRADNRFISAKAFKYLEELQVTDKEILREMDNYKASK
jgi:hypothetical protein